MYSIQTNKKPVWFFSEKMKREKKRQKSYSEYALHIFREFQSPSPKWSRKQESHSELVVFVCRETEEMLNWMLKLTERLNKWWIPRNDNKILQEMTKKTQSLCRFTQQIEQTCKSTDEIQFDLWHIYEIYETK